MILACAVWAALTLLGWFRGWTNENSGFVTAVGLFLVVPCALWVDRLIERKRRTQMLATSLRLLAHELWMNLNFVGQLGESHQNNLDEFEHDEPQGTHIPYFGPRTVIIERFLDAERFESLSEFQQARLVEIIAQLDYLGAEFSRWRDSLWTGAMTDRETYELASLNLLQGLTPAMKNMVWMWVEVISIADLSVSEESVREVYKKIITGVSLKGSVLTAYRASEFLAGSTELSEDHLYVCWENDLKSETGEGVSLISLNLVAPLHESWLPNE